MKHKAQESLDNLVKISCPQRTSCGECEISNRCNSLAKDYIDDIQRVIERATPKKPYYEHAPEPSKAYKYDCPKCGCFLSMNCIIEVWVFCPECGQALDWSDE